MPQVRASSGSHFVAGVVGFALLMDYLVYGLLIPLTPYFPAYSVGNPGSGLIYAAYSTGVLVATPLFGYLGDRIGYRRPMIYGVTLATIALALFYAAPNFYVVLTGRLFQGAGAAASWTAGLALIAEHYPENRVEMMGLALTGSTAGSLLGPIMGGSLYEAGGYALPFAAGGLLLAVDAVLRVCLLPGGQHTRESGPAIAPLLLDRSVLVAAAAVALAALGWGIIEPLLPVELVRSGVTAVGIGLIFTMGSLAYGVSAPVVGWVANRVPVRMVIAGGTVAMGIALPLLGLFRGAITVAICFSVVSICDAFMLNPTSAELGDAVDRRGMSCYAAVYAVYNIAYAVGQMAASGFATAAATSLSFLHALLCVSGALIVFTPMLMLRNESLSGVSS